MLRHSRHITVCYKTLCQFSSPADHLITISSLPQAQSQIIPPLNISHGSTHPQTNTANHHNAFLSHHPPGARCHRPCRGLLFLVPVGFISFVFQHPQLICVFIALEQLVVVVSQHPSDHQLALLRALEQLHRLQGLAVAVQPLRRACFPLLRRGHGHRQRQVQLFLSPCRLDHQGEPHLQLEHQVRLV